MARELYDHIRDAIADADADSPESAASAAYDAVLPVLANLDIQVRQLTARLKAAEDVCVMYGWSPAQSETARQKAAFELWSHWYGIVGPDFLLPEAHPDLSDEMVALLAAQRDETRAGALAKIRGER